MTVAVNNTTGSERVVTSRAMGVNHAPTPLGYDYHGRRVRCSRHARSIRYDERLLASIVSMDNGEPLETWREYRVNSRGNGYDVYLTERGSRARFDYINDPSHHYERYDGESFIPNPAQYDDYGDAITRVFDHEMTGIENYVNTTVRLLTAC